MSRAYCCGICDAPAPWWRVERIGDAVVSWACRTHLSGVCESLQRDGETTEVVVRLSTTAVEWPQVAAAIPKIGTGA